MAKYLDNNGVARLVANLKTMLSGKVDAVEGKGLSTNDFTDTLKTKVEGLENYSLPIASATEMGGFKVGAGLEINAETGVLSATGGGTADSIDWTNITSKPDLVLTSDLNTALSGVYKYKGSLANEEALDAVENPTVGDVYNLADTGMNIAWTGTEWDELGATINIESMTNAEVDALFVD